jgi:DUF2934 family protein
MAKRTPRPDADDSATTTPHAPRERRARAGAGATTDGRPGPEGFRPPEDASAAASGALEARRLGEQGPSDEEIRRRAYHLYLERGRQHGLHEDDWYRAEQELRKKN